MITILIVDDQEIVRQGLAIILRGQSDFQVVGLAEDGERALELAREYQPDVVLMDIKMPRLNGIQATQRLLQVSKATEVIILTTFDTDELVFAGIRAGAKGYLLKDAPSEVLIDAIRRVAAGESILNPTVARKVLEEFQRVSRSPAAPGRAAEPLLEKLTEREIEILQGMMDGFANKEIGAKLNLAEGTVKNHVSTILAKLHANDRTQAVVNALRQGIVKL
ncbi:MAG: response regulator transcription factor [Chloroflexi bacterium]|nr:response regulator transcription factor [Chloroflexota bacterium]